MPYAMRVYASTTLNIYRLDPAAYDLARKPALTTTMPGDLNPTSASRQ